MDPATLLLLEGQAAPPGMAGPLDRGPATSDTRLSRRDAARQPPGRHASACGCSRCAARRGAGVGIWIGLAVVAGLAWGGR